MGRDGPLAHARGHHPTQTQRKNSGSFAFVRGSRRFPRSGGMIPPAEPRLADGWSPFSPCLRLLFSWERMALDGVFRASVNSVPRRPPKTRACVAPNRRCRLMNSGRGGIKMGNSDFSAESHTHHEIETNQYPSSLSAFSDTRTCRTIRIVALAGVSHHQSIRVHSDLTGELSPAAWALP